MKYYFVTVLLLLSINCVKADDDRREQSRNDNVLIIDASNSLRGEVEGEAKVSILNNALSGFIEEWPEDEKLAVLSYGQYGKKEGCKRIRTLSSSKEINKDELLEKITKIKAHGRSPMISAIYKAERKLRNRKGNIILISDGNDDCRKKKSVCDLVEKMKKNHPEIMVHTIDMEGSNKTMQCIAEVTGGEYHTIHGLHGLLNSLFSINTNEADIENTDYKENYIEQTGKLVLQSVETLDGQSIPASYIIYSDEGKHVVSHTAQEQVEQTLPTGKYTVTSIHNLFTQEVKLQITPDDTINHTFVLGTSGELNLSSRYRGKPVNTLFTIYDSSGVELLSNISDAAFTQSLPVGRYKVEAQLDGDMKVVKVDVEKNDIKRVQIHF